MLHVLICAFGSGIEKLLTSLPAPQKDVTYYLSWQGENPDWERVKSLSLNREDLFITILKGRGLSRNRNNCIQMALERKAKGYFLFADDDVVFLEGFQDAIEKSFSEFAEAALICFQVRSADALGPFKSYPSDSRRINLGAIDRVSSIEISGRMEVLEAIRFDERLGLGSDFPSGEETAFLADCLRHGFAIRYVPVEIVSHPSETSGKRRIDQFSDDALRLVGGRAYRIYGSLLAQGFFLFSAVKNYRKARPQQSFFSYIRALKQGLAQFKRTPNG